MRWGYPSVLLVSGGDPAQVLAAAKLAQAGFEVVAASPTELADKMLVTLPFDAIIIDHDLGDEAIVFLKRVVCFSRDTLRIVIGGDPHDTEELRESGVIHHHFTAFDIDTLIPVLRAGLDEDDAQQTSRPKVNNEAG